MQILPNGISYGIPHAWLKKKSARKQFPDEGLLVLALQTELLRLLF